MDIRVNYFKRVLFDFYNIKNENYVSLAPLGLKVRPDEKEILKVYKDIFTGYVPIEVIKTKTAIELVEDESLKAYLKGML